MSNLYDEFEKKFEFSWFSAGWVEVDVKPQPKAQDHRKDLNTLNQELLSIQDDIENIAQKQLRLANLAKLYQF